MTNVVYNHYFYYNFDKLRMITFIYHLKAFVNPFYAIKHVGFLSNEQFLSNKQL